ncbi:MAG TPA: hypothetical protein PKE31_07955 [Pseudomonadota bacterium]|nr:hypothetical protein [Pseudomonadota bacterium]
MNTHVTQFGIRTTLVCALLGLLAEGAQAQQRVALSEPSSRTGNEHRMSRSEPILTVDALDYLPRLRPVLRGVMYRSGTPSEAALSRLCERGWKRVYSLYGEHTTQTGPRNVSMIRTGRDVRSCQTDGSARLLEWRSAPSARLRTLPGILRDVLDSIRKPEKGPVLVHCWNGLHYAGMVSALALRQFCGFTGEQAEAYWRANANRGATYPVIIANLHSFKPIPGLSLTPKEQQTLCPDLAQGYLVPPDPIVAAALHNRPRGGAHHSPIPPLRNAVETSEGRASSTPLPNPSRSGTPDRPAPLPSQSAPSGATSQRTLPVSLPLKLASRPS